MMKSKSSTKNLVFIPATVTAARISSHVRSPLYKAFGDVTAPFPINSRVKTYLVDFQLELRSRNMPKQHDGLTSLNSLNTCRKAYGREVLDENSGTQVGKEDITGYRINWDGKSKNAEPLSRALGVDLGSSVFLGDDPIQFAVVEAECPEVFILQSFENIEQLPIFIEQARAFDQKSSTDADGGRNAVATDYPRHGYVRPAQAAKAMQGLDFSSSIQPATGLAKDGDVTYRLRMTWGPETLSVRSEGAV